MQFEDDYERRRAYVSRRRQHRKRQRLVRILLFLLILGIIIITVGVGGYFLSGKNKTAKTKPSKASPAGSETPASTPSSEETTTTKDDRAEKLDSLLTQANALALTYDYDGAIELLNSDPEFAGEQAVKDAVSSYEETKSTLVRVDIGTITHVFFHSLIMDNSKAFDGDEDSKGYDQVMTTKSEFLKILDQMYQKGFVLVRMHDMAYETTDENGNKKFTAGNIMLPPGKKPFVMSQDDVCYYKYMDGDGFATRLVIGPDGKPACEMKMDDGTVSTGSYDLIPLLEDFITEHPDFSYKGARAVIAFTGYEGVMGYRTDTAYEGKNPNIEEDRETVKKLAQCLRDHGWELASHSWGHINMTKRTLDAIKTDTEKWKTRVEPLIGPTDILLFPYGADIGDWRPYTSANEKFDYLYQQGFRYFCNVDASQYWVQLGDTYLRQGRRNLDGYRMYYDLPETNPKKDHLSDLFDVSTVFDRDRPTPVPPM